jgi:hypothetical protein
VRLLILVDLSEAVAVCAVTALNLKSILGVGPMVKDSIEDPSDRRPGWEVFMLGYTLESKVRPLHQGYVSVTTLYLVLYSEQWIFWVWLPQNGFSHIEFSTSLTKILCHLICTLFC